MKKIVFAHLLNDFSGSPKVLSQAIEVCLEANYDVDVYYCSGSKGFLSVGNANRFYYPYKRFDNKVLTLLTFFYSQFSLFFKVLKYRNEEVVIFVNTMLPFGAALAGKLINKPVVYHIHETSIRPKILKFILRMFIQFTARKIIYVSKYLEMNEPVKGVESEVIYNSLTCDFFKLACSNNYSHSKNSVFSVLMVCSLKDYKGIKEFCRVAVLCLTETKIKFKLVLNAEETEIDTYFQKITVPSNVCIHSKKNNLDPFYSDASVVINLSRVDEWIETFGLTLLEAMAYGVPVIAPPVGGPAEIVDDGVDGFLISSYEVKLISTKLIEMFKNEELCIQLSVCARSKASQFKPKDFGKNIINQIKYL